MNPKKTIPIPQQIKLCSANIKILSPTNRMSAIISPITFFTFITYEIVLFLFHEAFYQINFKNNVQSDICPH